MLLAKFTNICNFNDITNQQRCQFIHRVTDATFKFVEANVT